MEWRNLPPGIFSRRERESEVGKIAKISSSFGFSIAALFLLSPSAKNHPQALISIEGANSHLFNFFSISLFLPTTSSDTSLSKSYFNPIKFPNPKFTILSLIPIKKVIFGYWITNNPNGFSSGKKREKQRGEKGHRLLGSRFGGETGVVTNLVIVGGVVIMRCKVFVSCVWSWEGFVGKKTWKGKVYLGEEGISGGFLMVSIGWS